MVKVARDVMTPNPECIGENLACLRIVIDNQSPNSCQIRDKAFAFLF